MFTSISGACHHGGKCIDRIGGYECHCPPGYVGQRCEGDVNECLSNPCSLPGTAECVQKVNDYECVCKAGWFGSSCEIQIDHCKGRTCQNGGVCVQYDHTHFCQCPPGYTGFSCEVRNVDKIFVQEEFYSNGISCKPKILPKFVWSPSIRL